MFGAKVRVINLTSPYSSLLQMKYKTSSCETLGAFFPIGGLPQNEVKNEVRAQRGQCILGSINEVWHWKKSKFYLLLQVALSHLSLGPPLPFYTSQKWQYTIRKKLTISSKCAHFWPKFFRPHISWNMHIFHTNSLLLIKQLLDGA